MWFAMGRQIALPVLFISLHTHCIVLCMFCWKFSKFSGKFYNIQGCWGRIQSGSPVLKYRANHNYSLTYMYFPLNRSVNVVTKENLCKILTVSLEIVKNKTLVSTRGWAGRIRQISRSMHQCFEIVLKVSCVTRMNRLYGPRWSFLALLFYTFMAGIGYN